MGVIGGVPPDGAQPRAHGRQPGRCPGGPHHWGVIGISRVQWMLVAAALTLGGSVRVGLEDNFYLPDGEMARSNGELIAKARQMTEDVGRRPATVDEAREHARRRPTRGLAARPPDRGRRVTLPLEGVRVLDLSRLLPGGFCSLLLADFGADVIKVEDTGMGDYVRWAPPYYEGADETASGALFLSLNRNKRSMRVDLKNEPGKEVLLRLVRDADVLLESFRPGVLDRLGVGYERLLEANPGLVYCAISGYGQDGPYRDRSGPRHELPRPDRAAGADGRRARTARRSRPAGQIADIGGGALMAAFGILAALRERDRSGEGQVVDVSMADGALSLAGDGGRPRISPTGPCRARGRDLLAGGLVCYRPYRVRRRLGHARRAGAEVLGRRGARASAARTWSSTSSRRRAPTRTREVEAHLHGAHARRVAELRVRARLLPGAGARPRRGARLRAGAGPRDGRRARPARGAGAGRACSACR